MVLVALSHTGSHSAKQMHSEGEKGADGGTAQERFGHGKGNEVLAQRLFLKAADAMYWRWDRVAHLGVAAQLQVCACMRNVGRS